MTLPRPHESETIAGMPASRFFEVLPILKDPQDRQVGLCLMGPIGTGDELIWMSGWAWQQDGDNVAASTGNAGVQVAGAHPLAQKDKPPFAAPETRWMVQTGFETKSAQYNVDKPALVQALALVKNGDDLAIVQWSQAVMLKLPYHHDGGAEHEHDDG
jgi:hypothetical protein